MGKLFADDFVEKLLKIPDFSRWELVDQVPVPEDVFHPQGMIKIQDKFYLTTVDKKKDRGLLFVFEQVGNELRTLSRMDITQGPRHRRYHPGGLDYFSSTEELWIPLAEYRARRPTTIVALKLSDMRLRVLGELRDHVGALICHEDLSLLRMTNWDTEGAYTVGVNSDFTLEGSEKNWLYQAHLGYFHSKIWGRYGRFAYQDCKSLGRGYAIATGTRRGIFWQHGVVDLIRFGSPQKESFSLIRRFELPPVRSPYDKSLFAIPLSRNPMMLEPSVDGKKIRFYFMPHDGPGACLFIYDAPLLSA